MPEAGQGIGPRLTAPGFNGHAARFGQSPGADIVALKTAAHHDPPNAPTFDLAHTIGRQHVFVTLLYVAGHDFRDWLLLRIDWLLRNMSGAVVWNIVPNLFFLLVPAIIVA